MRERRYHVVCIRFRGKGDGAVDERKVYLTRFSVTHEEGCTIMTKQVPRKGSRCQLEEVQSADMHESPADIIYLRDRPEDRVEPAPSRAPSFRPTPISEPEPKDEFLTWLRWLQSEARAGRIGFGLRDGQGVLFHRGAADLAAEKGASR